MFTDSSQILPRFSDVRIPAKTLQKASRIDFQTNRSLTVSTPKWAFSKTFTQQNEQNWQESSVFVRFNPLRLESDTKRMETAQTSI